MNILSPSFRQRRACRLIRVRRRSTPSSAPRSVVPLRRALVFLDAVAAVDHDRRAGDVAGRFGGQERHRRRHLVGGAGAADGRVEAADVLALARRARQDPAGQHGVDGDAPARHLDGQAAGEADHAGLGGAVEGRLRVADEDADIKGTLPCL